MSKGQLIESEASVPHKRYSDDEFDVVYCNDDDLLLLENRTRNSKNLPVKGNYGEKRQAWNELIICVEGEIWGELNGDTFKLSKNSILIVPSYFVVEHMMISTDAKIFNICFSNRISKKFMYNDVTLWKRKFYQSKDNDIMISDSDLKSVCAVWDVIKQQVASNVDKYDEQIIYMNIGIILCKMMRYIERIDNLRSYKNASDYYSCRGEVLFDRFLDLLAKTTPKRHPISFYANQLSITSNYLSVVCSKCSNKSVMLWIQDAVLEEVRYHLLQYNLSVQEVAERTGFDNLSFFTRYVKKHFGYTPTEFRRRNLRNGVI